LERAVLCERLHAHCDNVSNLISADGRDAEPIDDAQVDLVSSDRESTTVPSMGAGAASTANPKLEVDLTPREREVLLLMGSGATNSTERSP
jgi:hypothetical protein